MAQNGRSAIRIEDAGLADLAALRAMEAVCFPEDEYGWIDLFFLLAWHDVVHLKAVDEDGRIVGFVAGDPRPRRGFAWIVTLSVLPDQRRRGIGAHLLAACEARLKERILRLMVRASNTTAIQLYRRAGYREVKREPSYYPGGEDGLLMEKVRHA
jgi:ribosomal protein S18 acetylase RimI-like enzyme